MSTFQSQPHVPAGFPALARACQQSLRAEQQYQRAAALMSEASLQVIAHAFRFTAAQEKEHAAVLRGLLQACGAAHDAVPAGLPALPREPEALLRYALQQETACAEEIFPDAAREAAANGLPRIASALTRIAETEQLHARRFRQYLAALEDGTLLRSPAPTSWLCLPCGSLHFGCDAPERCDGCGCGPGHFIRSDFHPFAVRR